MSSFQEKLDVAEVPLIGSGPRASIEKLVLRWGTEDAHKLDFSNPPSLIRVRQLGTVPKRTEYWWKIGRDDKKDTLYECKEVKVDEPESVE